MVKNIISYILSFIMVALIIAIVAVSFLQNKVLNEDYWKMQMEQNNYYEKLEVTINDGFENYIMQSGMDSSVFEGIYDLDKVKEDTNSIVHAILNNEEFKIDTSTIREKLDNNIRKYIKDNKVLVNKTTENQIQNFENAIVSTYSNSVSYSSSVIKSISKIIERVRNIMPKALVLVVALLVIDAIAIIVLNIKNMRNIFKLAAIIAFTIAGLSLVGIALEKHFLGIQSLTVLNENISIIVQIFVKEIYRILYVATSCGTIIGIISSCVCANNKQISKN